MSPSIKNKIYFPGLNGLRFIAAFAVVITHLELMKNRLGIENYWKHPFVHELGGLGVSFFFVLSGFLITYLLLVESKSQGYFSVKNFYIRRIYRIWPLYFLIFIIGFFIIPNIPFFKISFFSSSFQNNYWENFILYFLMFPNLAFSIYSPVPLIGQAWSIGVEEQFYLFWPLFIRKLKKVSVKFLIITLLVIILVKSFALIVYSFYETKLFEVIKNFLAMAKFENMVIGAFGALFIINKKNRILNFIYKPLILLLAILGIACLTFINNSILRDGMHIVNAIFFLIIILNVSSNKSSFIKFENKGFNFLGKISYGIYMYHFIIVYIVLKLLSTYGFLENITILMNVFIYFLTTILTLIISYLSYEFFEKYFLSLKSKHSYFST